MEAAESPAAHLTVDGIGRDDENICVLTVGLPRSGKSTWAKLQGVPVVSPDSIRLAIAEKRFDRATEPEVWRIAPIMVRALFNAGHSRVIVDATNLRREWRSVFADDAWRQAFVQFPADAGTCIERARQTGQESLIPFIQKAAGSGEPIGADEGAVFHVGSDGLLVPGYMPTVSLPPPPAISLVHHSSEIGDRYFLGVVHARETPCASDPKLEA